MSVTPAPAARPHPAWATPAPSPAARALAPLVVEGAALLRQLALPGRPPAAAQRQQAARLLRLAEAVLAALDPGPAPPAAAEAARLRERVAAALTPREREVLGLLATGQTDRQIAERLGVAHRTATTHVGRVLAKLGLRSRAAAASLAVRAGYA